MRRLAVLVLCVLGPVTLLGACSDDGEKKADVGDEVTTSAPVETTTTSTTVISGPPQSAQAAADGLFAAWKAGDRDGASRYARQRAIDRMFAQPYVDTPDNAEYEQFPCEPEGGQFQCRWRYEGGSIQLTVESVVGGGFVVDDVIRTAD